MQLFYYDSPFFERFQTQFRRRSIVAAYLLATLAVAVASRFMDSIALETASTATTAAMAVVGAVGLAAITVAGVLLSGSTRGIADSDQMLDERQSWLNAFAYRDAFWPAIVVAAFAGMTVSDLLTDEHWLYAAGITTAASALICGLPAMLLAWRLPDERDEV